MQKEHWTFCIYTFGCKVNQYESQSIREAWQSFKGREVKDFRHATVILLNTCGVTANAITDIRQIVNKVYNEAPSAKVIITGCATKIIQNQLSNLTKHYLSIHQKNKEQLLKNPCIDTSLLEVNSTISKNFPSFSIKNFHRSRPIIKIQDGCSSCCSYCIIPSARGGSSSRKADECLKEIQTLLHAGYREIILSGINLHQYSDHQKGYNTFWDLLLFINKNLAPEWQDIARIRISSLDPAQFTNHSFEVIANSSMLCPQLHISIQSGSKYILKSMRRTHYTPEHLLSITQKLSSIWPVFGLGADIITGFPGETNTHLQETITLIHELPLTYAHVFPFSPRPGTIAAKLPKQITPAERQHRAQTIRKIIKKKQDLFHKKLLNLPTLHITPEHSQHTSGLNEYYTVCVFSLPIKNNDLSIIKVKPLSITSKGILVEPITS